MSAEPKLLLRYPARVNKPMHKCFASNVSDVLVSSSSLPVSPEIFCCSLILHLHSLATGYQQHGTTEPAPFSRQCLYQTSKDVSLWTFLLFIHGVMAIFIYCCCLVINMNNILFGRSKDFISELLEFIISDESNCVHICLRVLKRCI